MASSNDFLFVISGVQAFAPRSEEAGGGWNSAEPPAAEPVRSLADRLTKHRGAPRERCPQCFVPAGTPGGYPSCWK